MKEFLEIILCMFAIYGVYRFCIGLGAALSRRVKIVYAVRAEETSDFSELEKNINSAASLALDSSNAELVPVILTDRAESVQFLCQSGYEVYLSQKADSE